MEEADNIDKYSKDARSVFEREEDKTQQSKPIWLVPDEFAKDSKALASIEKDEKAEKWLTASGFKAKAGQHITIPNSEGGLKGVAFALGGKNSGKPCGPGELLLGKLARELPAGSYHLFSKPAEPELAAIAWGLGAYRFERYKSQNSDQPAKLVMPTGLNHDSIINIIEAIWLGRDLINTPASDLGPAQLEETTKTIAQNNGAQISIIEGEELLEKNFPMIHAVGRASPRAPRLIDLRWQPKNLNDKAPRVTLIGKGITFDTGGLDLKPASNMILMKKDMGGAASTLALAKMIMGAQLKIRLRVLIAAAENSVSGNAFRPSDILKSRSGLTVEVGNTDAEGRLVLADALSYADEEKPDYLISMATLTGAARVALGTDLPALFCTCDAFSQSILETGQAIGDPLWRLPFWRGYDNSLDSHVADISNISNGPFAGAITAALFLKRFVKNAHTYAHVDMYGWRPVNGPLGPKGGEAHAARTLFAEIRKLTKD